MKNNVHIFKSYSIKKEKMKQILLTILVLINIQSLYACECRSNSLKVEIDNSAEIFQGKVVQSEKVNDGYIFQFEIQEVWKGSKENSKKIKTGFGGGDCGMNFEKGKSYIVYSNNKETNRCRRNSEIRKTKDDLKLKYYFSEELKNKSFQGRNKKLNEFESEYLNEQFEDNQLNFNFSGKSIAFTIDKTIINKSLWFKRNWNHDKPVIQLLEFTKEEKEQLGYDAILVTWSKIIITKRQRKKLIRKLKRKTE
jgi:hypothetical protein